MAAAAGPGVTQRRIDAVSVMADRASDLRSSYELPEFPEMVGDAVALMEKVLRDEPDRAFRRYALARSFGGISAIARDHVARHPEDDWARKAWKRLDAVRRRALKDKDPLLADFFFRFVALPGGPVWAPYRKSAEACYRSTYEALPQHKAVIDSNWAQCVDIGKRQSGAIDKTLAITAPAYKRQAREVIEYRNYILWSNLCPSFFRAIRRSQNLPDAGCRSMPVKIGWPNYK